VDSTKEHTTYSILSYCYGYGGLDKGISRVLPTRVAAYVEIEAFQDFNLVAAMESGMVDKAPIWTDVKTFDPHPFRQRVHGIIGGYPCQGESLAGKRKLWDDPRFLWPFIGRSVSTIRPLFCLFENVGGHLTGSFPYVEESLRDMDYAIEAGLFTAQEVGAPHKRERLFILAIDRRATTSEIQQLVDSHGKRNRTGFGKVQEPNGEIHQRHNNAKFIDSGQTKLGNTKHNGRPTPEKPRGIGSSIRDTEERKIGTSQSKGTSSSGELADTSEQRFQRKQQKPSGKRHSGLCNRTRKDETQELWPARPGQQQHKWEESRTTKPGLGCTVNGYNFRTELLRQYGNGVVSETASLAFQTLLNKLICDNSRNL